MSPRRRHALAVAEAALRRRRELRGLSHDDKHAVEAVAASIAVQVADAIDAVFEEATLRRARAEN
jgi:hypothetical protein